MNIYLRHPRHGEKVATMELEAVYDEKNGWVRFDPTAPADGNAMAAQTRRPRRVAAEAEA